MAFAVIALFSLVWLSQETPPERRISISQRVSDMTQLIGTFQRYYAMGELKKEKLGVDLDNAAPWIEKAQNPGLSDEEFAALLIDYASQFDDGHVALTFPFNWTASLGFTVDVYPSANGEDLLRVVSINRDRLPDNAFKFQNGWELRSINGESAQDLLQKYTRFATSGNAMSTKRLAARLLTQRLQSILPFARQSVVGPNLDSTSICPATTRFLGNVASVEFWDYAGTPLTVNIKWCIAGEDRLFTPLIAPSQPVVPSDGPVAEIPASRAQLVVSPKEPFVRQSDWEKPQDSAFFYKTLLTDNTNGSQYLFIRIPSFSLDPAFADQQRTERVNAFKNLLTQDRTLFFDGKPKVKGLILDLMGNPGGSIWFAQQLLEQVGGIERGSGVSIRTALFKVRPSYERLDAFDSYKATPNIDSTALAGFNDARRIIEEQLEKDRRALTDPIPINLKGSVLLTAAAWPAQFRMPVLVLVDELTASAGDLFAAVVKEQGLGAVVGVRTMGAGGTVAVYRGPVATEASVSLTVSQMQDAAGNDLENVGVTPDQVVQFRTEEIARIMNTPVRPGFLPEVTPFMKKVYEIMRDRRKAMRLP